MGSVSSSFVQKRAACGRCWCWGRTSRERRRSGTVWSRRYSVDESAPDLIDSIRRSTYHLSGAATVSER